MCYNFVFYKNESDRIMSSIQLNPDNVRQMLVEESERYATSTLFLIANLNNPAIEFYQAHDGVEIGVREDNERNTQLAQHYLAHIFSTNTDTIVRPHQSLKVERQKTHFTKQDAIVLDRCLDISNNVFHQLPHAAKLYFYDIPVKKLDDTGYLAKFTLQPHQLKRFSYLCHSDVGLFGNMPDDVITALTELCHVLVEHVNPNHCYNDSIFTIDLVVDFRDFNKTILKLNANKFAFPCHQFALLMIALRQFQTNSVIQQYRPIIQLDSSLQDALDFVKQGIGCPAS